MLLSLLCHVHNDYHIGCFNTTDTVPTWVIKLWELLLQHVAELTVQLTEMGLKQRLVKHLQAEGHNLQMLAERCRTNKGKRTLSSYHTLFSLSLEHLATRRHRPAAVTFPTDVNSCLHPSDRPLCCCLTCANLSPILSAQHIRRSH